MSIQKKQLTKEEVLVLDFVNFLIKNKKFIASVTGVTILLSCLIFLFTPTYYMATATALPVLEKTTSREKSAQTPASLLNLTGKKSEQNALIMATLRARSFIENYMKQHKVSALLFSDKWDSKKNTWKDKDNIPSLTEQTEIFHKLFAISENKSKEYFDLSMKSKDPELAALWLNQLITALNDHFREKTLETTTKNMTYLNDRIRKTTAIEVRQNLSDLLQRETLKNMVAQNEKSYALEAIDKAAVPEKKHSPKFLLYLGMGLFFGLIFGVFLAFLRRFSFIKKQITLIKKKIK